MKILRLTRKYGTLDQTSKKGEWKIMQKIAIIFSSCIFISHTFMHKLLFQNTVIKTLGIS